MYVPALPDPSVASKGPPAGKMYGSIRRKGSFNREYHYVSGLSMIPGSNLSDINLFLREILLSILSFLFLKRPNIANLKADVFCFGRLN